MPPWLVRRLGPFVFQPNSWTRAFEYPWCFYTIDPRPGMNLVELGAGASGLQFVLSQEQVEVTSVDPLVAPEGVNSVHRWSFSASDFEKLNAVFGTNIRFINDHLQNAKLPAESFDAVLSVSVIEHIPPDVLPGLMREIARILKPSGRFVATVDLFSDCQPFTELERNRFGTNVSIRDLVEHSGLELIAGDRSVLCGYREFQPLRIQQEVDRYLKVSNVLTQCVVMQKPH
jgi:SAM-dependent methyltransferase